MCYLHSHNILHRNLKPESIYLDKDLYPKLSGFEISKTINNDLEKSVNIKGTPAYLSPEINLKHEYSKSSDVYSYSLILYELITNIKPYQTINNIPEMKEFICDKQLRPTIPITIPNIYRELIERCWSQDPKDRPTFEEILQTLKTNPEFITESVDKEEFYQYISTIDNSEITFNSNNIKYEQLTNFIKMDIRFYANFEDNINFIGIYDTETKNIDLNFKPFNIQNFIKKKKFYDEEICKHYEIVDPQTNKSYYAKEYALAIGKAETFEEISIFLIREIKVLSQANHPSIVKYYGFSSVDFKNRLRPVIITEFPPNGTLHQILELQHEGKSFPGWNDTKKLINVYGIASSMSYLHSHNVLHLFFISISCFFR